MSEQQLANDFFAELEAKLEKEKIPLIKSPKNGLRIIQDSLYLPEEVTEIPSESFDLIFLPLSYKQPLDYYLRIAKSTGWLILLDPNLQSFYSYHEKKTQTFYYHIYNKQAPVFQEQQNLQQSCSQIKLISMSESSFLHGTDSSNALYASEESFLQEREVGEPFSLSFYTRLIGMLSPRGGDVFFPEAFSLVGVIAARQERRSAIAVLKSEAQRKRNLKWLDEKVPSIYIS